MFFVKIIIAVFLSTCLISTSIYAEGVFLSKKRSSHELSKAELRKINLEFLQKFGSKKSATSANPWKAKKERNQKQNIKMPSWSECRDYALQQRNQCYKEGRQAYYCERFYAARSVKCNQDY